MKLARRDWADIATLAFGTTTTMWALGYLTHLPGIATPSPAVFFLLMTALLAGGICVGRWSDRGWRGGFQVGLFVGLLNLLIIGAAIGKEFRDGTLPNPALWVIGSIGLSILLMTIGAATGTVLRQSNRVPAGIQPGEPIPTTSAAPTDFLNPWPSRFAMVASAATLFLISVGGTVTGFKAGLAVPDWPNSYGYNMFLLPLSKMTGGIYFEHSHRLFGSLVGLTTVALASYLQLRAPRPWLKWIGWLAVVLVIVQGIMGGLRVTGTFTLTTDRSLLSPSTLLAVVHGVFAQLFLATLVSLMIMLRPAWLNAAPPEIHTRAGADRVLGFLSVGLVLTQSIMGALYRHFEWGLHLHLTVAVIVLAVAGTFGMRCWGTYKNNRLAATGALLVYFLGVQLALGFAALALRLLDTSDSEALHYARVIGTTLHQTFGAVVLAATWALVIWLLRATRPIAASSHSPSPTPKPLENITQ